MLTEAARWAVVVAVLGSIAQSDLGVNLLGCFSFYKNLHTVLTQLIKCI